MIKLRDTVPSVYTNASRDFQYLSWLIDIVLNSVKHNVDDLYNLPNTKADPHLAELLAMTLGFKIKRNYDQKQLAALVVVLPRILKYKGTAAAVDIVGNALIAATGHYGSYSSRVDGAELEVIFPKSLIDVSLFTDLLPYILPAGMTYRIIRIDQIKKPLSTEVGYQENMRADFQSELDWDRTKHTSTGLSGLFNVPGDRPNFANYHDDLTLNIGLLNNNIITSVTETLQGPINMDDPYSDEDK